MSKDANDLWLKLILLVVLMLAFSMLLSSCVSPTNVSNVNTVIEMSELELSLLLDCYTDGDRVREGKLFSHQEEGLRQLRAGMQYMDKKYPSYTLEYSFFEPATKFSGHATLYIDESDYEVHVSLSDSGYTCSDNFYEKLIRDEYDALVRTTLEKRGYSVNIFTSFPSPVDNRLNETSSVRDYLEEYPKLTRDTDIYLDISEEGLVDVESIRSALRSHGFYGAYTLYYVNGPVTDLECMIATRKDYPYVCFNCFDV